MRDAQEEAERRLAKREGTRDGVKHVMKHRQSSNAKVLVVFDINISHLIDKDVYVFRSTEPAAVQSSRATIVVATAGVSRLETTDPRP